MAEPTGMAPASNADARTLDQWNQAWRGSTLYQEAFRAVGANPNGAVKLSDQQREMMREFLKSKGVQFPSQMEIDPAGNFNQNEGFGKQAKKWGPIVGAGAALAFGIPGLTQGLLTGGSAGAAGAGAGALAPGAGITGGAVGAPTFFGVGGGAGLGGALSGIGAGTAGAGIGAGTAAAAGGGSSILGSIGKFAKDHYGDILSAGGAAIGSATEAAAQNRGAKMDAQEAEALFGLKQDAQYRDALVQREQEGRAGRNDAQRGLQQAEYILNNTKDYTPKDPRMGSYGIGPHAATETEKAGFAGVRDETLGRLQGGNPIPAVKEPVPFQFENVEPGFLERVGSWAAPGLSVWGAIRRMQGQSVDRPRARTLEDEEYF